MSLPRIVQFRFLVIEFGDADPQKVYDVLMATKYSGAEAQLIRLCENKNVTGAGRWTALKALGLFDTAQVRDYLLENLDRESDPASYLSTGLALAKLKEQLALKPITQKILQFEEGWDKIEAYLLHVVRLIDAESSSAFFEQYIADENATELATAVFCLSKAKPTLARDIASELLKNGELSSGETEVLRRIIGDQS